MKPQPSPNSRNDHFRSIIIRNFRNIGIRKDTGIVINRSLERDELGNVVILVGQNNSGKTNVLDAIMVASNGRMSDDDIPDRSLVGEYLLPSVYINVNDGSRRTLRKNIIAAKREDTGTKARIVEDRFDIESVSGDSRFKGIVKDILIGLSRSPDVSVSKRANALMTYSELTNTIIDFVYRYSDFESVTKVSSASDASFFFDTIYRISANHGPMQPSYKKLDSEKKSVTTPAEQQFLDTYGYPLIPNVIRYSEERISGSDLTSTYKPLNLFMRNVLMLIGGLGTVVTAYNEYLDTKSEKSLKDAEASLNESLKPVADDFNNVYLVERFPYRFVFELTPESISFKIKLSDIDVYLGKQSTGFRWYFDFYFNFLAQRKLEAGDIVIMDEPATNLHVAGQKELMDFIRRYARSLGITFIISTHSPFFIDCDHLDEVRIVKRIENGSSVIEDRFSMVDYRNPDQMDAILKSLTIGRNVLFNHEDVCFFVEGITDYNYLVAFKLLFGIEGLHFIPINGVGVNEEEREGIKQKLLKVSAHPILLADGDIGGMMIRDRAEGSNLKVILLSDIDESFNNIESLFDEYELEMFGLTDKSWNNSSVFKNNIADNDESISETTKNNFRKVFDHLTEYCRQ